MYRVLDKLALHARSAAGQQALASRPDLHSGLAANEHLHGDVWDRLWAAKPKAATAESLLGRPLSSDRLDAVVRRERRQGALVSLVTKNHLSVEQATRLLSTGKVTDTIANNWLGAGTVPAELEWQVAEIAGPSRMLAYMTAHPEVDDAAVLDLVRSLRRSLSTEPPLARLLEARPHLLAEFARSGLLPLEIAAASSRHLFDADLMAVLALRACELVNRYQPQLFVALLDNPNLTPAATALLRENMGTLGSMAVHRSKLTNRERWLTTVGPVTVPWEQVTDPAQLSLLVMFASASAVRRAFVRTLPGLTAAQQDKLRGWVPPAPRPEADVDEAELRATPLSALDGRDMRASARPASMDVVGRRLAGWLDELGDDAWANALSLLEGDFEGTVDDLLAVCRVL